MQECSPIMENTKVQQLKDTSLFILIQADLSLQEKLVIAVSHNWYTNANETVSVCICMMSAVVCWSTKLIVYTVLH